MPTYQYRCTECGNDLEVVQKFSDPTLTVCPNCEGALRKVFNAVGVVFKGSGFYRTDSRTSGDKSASGTRSKSESSEASSGKSADSATSSSGSSAEKSSGGSSEKSTSGSSEKATSGSSTSSKAASS